MRIYGFLIMDGDGLLHLTNIGQSVAEKIYEWHCFFYKYPTEIGVELNMAESDACKLEHTISCW